MEVISKGTYITAYLYRGDNPFTKYHGHHSRFMNVNLKNVGVMDKIMLIQNLFARTQLICEFS